ncbi:MAG: PHP domain-containing protein, partial [Massilibacteroides sp.]|nr:PHP domain-containing protein [Massilibacteroides sp.]
MEPFIHLHVHTQYSLLDGQAAIDRILAKASKDGMHSIAITDHGNMFGIKEFTNRVKKLNAKRADNDKFKPIIGCECYCARNGRHIKSGRENLNGWHLILLAKNKNGYKNLIKMVSLSWTEGFYGKPRIDKELLQKYHKDVICCSACIAGEIPNKVLKGQYKEAKEAALWFKNLFGDDYYLEMQRHKTNRPDAAQDTYLKQQEANEGLIKIAKELHIKLIATNDVHFVEEEDAEAHDRLICLSTGKDLDDPKRMRYSKQEWMKTTEEMNQVFEDYPEALRNTTEIADKVEYYSIDNGPIMPTFQI